MDRKVKKIIADISAVALLGSYICVPLSNSGISLDVTGLFPENRVSAQTSESYTHEGFTYIVNDEKITITKFDDSISEVSIPEQIDNKPVVCIGESAFEKCKMTSVVIPGSVEEIKENAFKDCLNLKSLTLSEGLTKLGYHAFYGTALTEITIPASLTKSNAPFENCTSLTSVKFAENCSIITYNLFAGCSKITNINIPDSIETIDEEAFEGCTGLTCITIPGTVKVIKSGAFYNCSNIKKVILNEGIQKLGYHAFSGTAISEITIPASLTDSDEPFSKITELTSVKFAGKCSKITYGLFSGCSNIKQIDIPESVETIDEGAFAGCTGLTSITIPGTVKTIKSNAFKNCSNIKKITLNEGIETLGYHAFSGTSISEITIPASLTQSNQPFSEITDLTSVKFAANCSIITYGLFAGCSNITKIDIPDSIETIDEEAFEGCTGFTDITIPGTVKTIKSNAFKNCSNIKKVTLNEGTETLGYHAFSGTAISEITIPGSLTGSNAPFDECKDMTSVKFAANCSIITYGLFAGCSNITQIDIPESIETIDEGAFTECTGLTEVTIPGTVKTIKSNAFKNCSNIKEIKLSEGIETVGYHAFSGTAISEITIPATIKSCSSPFSDCARLEKIKFADNISLIPESLFKDCNKITEVIIPDTVTKIETAAFEDCSALEMVTLNEGLKSIGYHAFTGTPIKEIDIPSTLETSSSPFAGCAELTKVCFADNITFIPESLLKECKMITSVDIPDTVTQIGMAAFEGCSALESVTLNEGLTQIGYHAFSETPIKEINIPLSLKSSGSPFAGCAELTKVNFAEGITSVPEALFKGCTGLKEITVPQTVTEIGVAAFENCSSLQEINLNEGLKQIGFHAFSETAIKNIIIPSTVTDLSSPPFSGCSLFTHAAFADATESVPDNIFKDCKSLVAVRLPDSAVKIGNSSFSGCKALKTITSSLSDIDYKASSFFDCISLRDQRFSVIDHNNSGLSANAESCTVNGTINCTLRYKISDKFADKCDNYSVVLDIPEGMVVLPDSVVCGEDKPTVSSTDPFTITLSKPEATVKFTARVQEYGDFRITGSVKFRSNFETWKQTVGTLDISAPDITINAADTVNSFSVDISGIAAKGSDVSVYADDQLAATVKSNEKTGKYQSTIKLPEKQSGESYSLYATCNDITSESINVLYTEEKPVVENATLRYNKGTYATDDITDVFTQGASPAFYFNPAYPLVFEIKASNTDKIDKMFVSSTKGTQMKNIEAVWNEESQSWIASGYFDPDNTRYVPGSLNISIVEKKEVKYDRNSTTENPQTFKKVSENLKKNSSVKINKKTDKSVAADIKVSDGKKSGNVSLVTENTDSTYINGTKVKAVDIAKNPAKYGFVKSNVKSTEDGKTYSYYVSTPDTKDIVSEVTGIMGDAYHTMDNICSGVAVLEVFEGDKSDTFEAKICNSFITSASKTILSDYIGDYTFGGAFSIAGDTYDFMSRLSGTDSEQIQCAAIVLYGLQAFNTFGTETVLTLCGCPPVVSSVISGFISVGLGYVGDYLDECISENKEFSLDGFITFLIDPSGYIYEAVESNRVSDAMTTLYYLDPKTNKPVKWIAEDYSQVNPLSTDSQGAYAWDVPEGKWKVKCEKEGYTTVESEWLDVPPAQTEVNLSLISYKVPEISRIDAYQNFVSVKFSKYMDISTVSSDSLMLMGDDKKIACTVIPQPYNDGDKFTDTFLLKTTGETLEKNKKLKVESTATCHSYSGTAAKAQSMECTLNTDIFDITSDSPVTVLTPGTDSQLIFTASPAEIAAGKELIIKDESGIISYEDNVKFDSSGIAKVKVNGQKAGTTKISVSAGNSEKCCEAEIVVINSPVKSNDKTEDKNDYLKGDIDNSGVVNAVDIVILKKYLLMAISDKEAPNGDVDGSGKVDAMDLVALISLFLD